MAKEEKNAIGDNLLRQACEAYGIEARYVVSSRCDEAAGEVVIVTHGGSKVRWRPGEKPEKLSRIAVTGVNPDAARRKVIAGRAKE